MITFVVQIASIKQIVKWLVKISRINVEWSKVERGKKMTKKKVEQGIQNK